MKASIFLTVSALLICFCLCTELSVNTLAAQQAATEKCTSASDCHTLTTDKMNYCAIQSNTCTTPASHTFPFSGNFVTSPQDAHYCSDSLFQNVVFTWKCVKLAGKGCATPTADKDSYLCMAGSGSWNGTVCDYSTQPSTPTTYKTNGEACDPSKTDQQCGYNLVCLRNVCRMLPGVGEPCLSGSCAGTLSCNLGYCTAPYSLPAFSGCNTNKVCTSGSCSGGFCTYSSRNQACYTNTDCSSGECDMRTTNAKGQGRCFAPIPIATQKLTQCTVTAGASTYYPNVDQAAVDSKCIKERVQVQCAINCPKRKDQRLSYGDANIYDCKALTLTPLSATTCAVTEQFLNCDGYMSYENAAIARSPVMLLIAAVIAVTFMLF